MTGASFWSAATESAESPLSVGGAVAAEIFVGLSTAEAKSGDFAGSVTAVQNASEDGSDWRLRSSLPTVTTDHHAAIHLDHRIAPRQVSTGSLAFGMLDSPSDDLPPIPGFRNLPFGTVGPCLSSLQQSLRNRDLVAVAALRILGLLHAIGLPAASGEQREKKSDNQASGHPLHVGMGPFGSSRNKCEPSDAAEGSMREGR
jgi:hypothetical protein